MSNFVLSFFEKLKNPRGTLHHSRISKKEKTHKLNFFKRSASNLDPELNYFLENFFIKNLIAQFHGIIGYTVHSGYTATLSINLGGSELLQFVLDS